MGVNRPVWARKLVYANGRYDPRFGFLSIIRQCKRLEMPLILSGPITDSSYYRECWAESYGSMLQYRRRKERADLCQIARVYVFTGPLDLTSIQAIKCGCRIVGWGYDDLELAYNDGRANPTISPEVVKELLLQRFF